MDMAPDFYSDLGNGIDRDCSIFLKNVFIFGYTRSLLLCAGFPRLWQVGTTSCCCAWTSHCDGFSCCRAWALGARTSVVAAHRLSSRGSQALELGLGSSGTRA